MTWKKAPVSYYIKEIKNNDWNYVKSYTLPEIRFAYNEGDFSKDNYNKFLKLIAKKFNKEIYEL